MLKISIRHKRLFTYGSVQGFSFTRLELSIYKTNYLKICRQCLIQEPSLTDGKELFYIQPWVNQWKDLGSAVDRTL